jgi:hypothetical protein
MIIEYYDDVYEVDVLTITITLTVKLEVEISTKHLKG